MKLNKLFILLLPLSLVACNNNQKEPEKPDPSLLTTPLCMTCISDFDGVIDIMHFIQGDPAEVHLQYSKNNRTWEDIDFSYGQFPLLVKKGETVYFRGNNPNGLSKVRFETHDQETLIYGHIVDFSAVDGLFNIGGNVMSLLQPKGFDKLKTIPCDGCFCRLFETGAYLDASKLSLPATNLKPYCYYEMFAYDKYLTYVPYLPATELIDHCYEEMFYDCTNLKKLEVEFDETAFDNDSPYTQRWLEPPIEPEVNDEPAPTFIWNGSSSLQIERNESTIPEGWEIVSKQQ